MSDFYIQTEREILERDRVLKNPIMWEHVGALAEPLCDITRDLSDMYELHTEILDIGRKTSKLVFSKEKRKRFDNLVFIRKLYIKWMEEKLENFRKKYTEPYTTGPNKTKNRFTW